MRLFARLKGALLLVLRSPIATAALGVVFFACLVWVAGPLVGLAEALPRGMVIAAALVFWVMFLLIERFRNVRGAKLLEAALQQQAREQVAASRPDRKEEVEALKGQFDRAVASLKSSKLGRGRSGRAVLSALPWYMFIGPPGSGKSTALLHSGLQFPSVGEQGRGVRGVGGTRNCDWWFTRDAVLLDTAGRYVTEEDDREEWLAFLDLLKRARRHKALNGVLAAISIVDLLQASDEELESHAKKIRARIDELVARLGLVFPVYLLFTKCDLVRGFVEFFEDFSRAERDQIWGCTFARASDPEAPARRFEAEYRRLGESLEARRTARLASARGSQKIRDIYGFPLQLASGGDKLARFVEVLFEPSPYHEAPIFRGFYLTSGTQEGTPIDRILGAVSRASGLSDVISESFEERKETKSYFIRALFTDVIFPDQTLAGSSSAMEKQRGYLRVGMFVGAVAASILAVVGLSVSFVANKQLTASVKRAALRAVQMNPADERQFVANVTLLDGLRARLETLREYEEEGLPLRLRGLYRGWALSEPVQALYVRQFNAMFLAPTRSVMEVDLAGFVAKPASLPADRDSEYYYSLLKAYLMLSGPSRLDPPFVNRWLEQLWREILVAQYGEGRVPEGLEDTVRRQLVFYGEQLTRDRVPPLEADARLVAEVQALLRRIPAAERAYARVRRLGSEGLEPYTLESALKGRRQDVLLDAYRVPGLFTQKGTGAFQQAMATVLDRSSEEGWVLGVAEPPRVDVESAIEALYAQEYVAHWRDFLDAVQIRRAESIPELAKELDVLAADDSPLVAVLEDVAAQTAFGSRAGAPAGLATNLVQKVKRGLRLDGGEAQAAPESSSHPVSVRFRFLHDFVSPSADGKAPAPVAAYVNELLKVREAIQPLVDPNADTQTVAQTVGMGGASELSAAVRNTERMVQGFDPEARRIVGGLLLQPVQLTLSSVTSMAQGELNKRWRAEVYEPCVRSIAGRYPFSPNGDDASFTDVAEFFHPQDGALWRFYDRDLKGLVNEGTDRWTPKRQSGGVTLSPELLDQLRRARLIADSLFPRGVPDPKVMFDVFPYPIPGASEVVLQVDGNGLRYRNEPQEWHELVWPGSGGASGAAVQVQLGGRAGRHFAGRWGLFKLLDSAQAVSGGPSRYRVEWDLPIDGSRAVKVRYDLRAQSYKNPFRRGFFSEFRCVAQVG